MHVYYTSRDLFVSDLSVTPFVLFASVWRHPEITGSDSCHQRSSAGGGWKRRWYFCRGIDACCLQRRGRGKRENGVPVWNSPLLTAYSIYTHVMLLLLLALIESGETLTIIAKVNICRKLFLLGLRGGGVDVVCSYFLLHLSLLFFSLQQHRPTSLCFHSLFPSLLAWKLLT